MILNMTIHNKKVIMQLSTVKIPYRFIGTDIGSVMFCF